MIATLALFIALGGSSYAALKLPKNSVKAKQIATGAVTGSEIKNRSLGTGEFKPSALASLKGPKGDKGAAGATNVVMREGASSQIPANSFGTAVAACQAGERATGGGVYNEANVLVLQVTSSYPTPNPTSPPATGNGQVPTGWRVWLRNDSATPYNVNAYVICARP